MHIQTTKYIHSLYILPPLPSPLQCFLKAQTVALYEAVAVLTFLFLFSIHLRWFCQQWASSFAFFFFNSWVIITFSCTNKKWQCFPTAVRFVTVIGKKRYPSQSFDLRFFYVWSWKSLHMVGSRLYFLFSVNWLFMSFVHLCWFGFSPLTN